MSSHYGFEMDYLWEKSHFRLSKEGLYPCFEQVSSSIANAFSVHPIDAHSNEWNWNLKPHTEDDWSLKVSFIHRCFTS